MSDLIDRQAAIDAIADGLKGIFVEYRDIAEKMIGKLPSAQPHGKWILETYQIRCTHCNKLFSDYLFPSNYCPNCGARMEGER